MSRGLRAARACLVCGCHELEQCPGGCTWTVHEPPLCSACVAHVLDQTGIDWPHAVRVRRAELERVGAPARPRVRQRL